MKSARVNDYRLLKVISTAVSPVVTLYLPLYAGGVLWVFDQVAEEFADQVIFLHLFADEDEDVTKLHIGENVAFLPAMIGHLRMRRISVTSLTRNVGVEVIRKFVDALLQEKFDADGGGALPA